MYLKKNAFHQKKKILLSFIAMITWVVKEVLGPGLSSLRAQV